MYVMYAILGYWPTAETCWKTEFKLLKAPKLLGRAESITFHFYDQIHALSRSCIERASVTTIFHLNRQARHFLRVEPMTRPVNMDFEQTRRRR